MRIFNKSVVACLAEMYVQGVSTRKVKTITEELCGHAFSASSISRINKTLDDELKKLAIRRLDEEYPYLILDARYEKVREDGVIRTRAVMIAIGINWDGRRSGLAVELANRESQTSWKECLVGLKQRGLAGVEFVVSDHHLGLKKAIGVPKQSGNAATYTFCAMPWIIFRGRPTTIACRNCDGSTTGNLEEARRDLGAWLAKWQKKYPKLCMGRGKHRGDARLIPLVGIDTLSQIYLSCAQKDWLIGIFAGVR